MRDTLSLKNTKLGLETLERMEYDRRRVKILLNRANTNVGIEREDVLAILGRDVDVLVPSHRDITRSVNQGQPIATAARVPRPPRRSGRSPTSTSRRPGSGPREDHGGPVIELPGAAEAPAERRRSPVALPSPRRSA